MERDNKPSGRPSYTQDGWRPINEGHRPQIDKGHQPSKPDAGHQPARRAVALSLQPSGPALSPRRPKSLASSLLSSFHERGVASLLRRRLLPTQCGRQLSIRDLGSGHPRPLFGAARPVHNPYPHASILPLVARCIPVTLNAVDCRTVEDAPSRRERFRWIGVQITVQSGCGICRIRE